MKRLNKLILFFLFMLFNYGIDTFCYTYTIANMTGRDVKVRLFWDWGELTNRSALISSYATRKLRFGGWEAGLCLTKILVSIKTLGKWEKARKAKMGILKDEGRFKDLKESGSVGKLVTGAIEFFGFSLCRSRNFVLIRDWEKIYAITTIGI